jgi:hypothetical protein
METIMEWIVLVLLGLAAVYGASAVNLYYGYRTLF